MESLTENEADVYPSIIKEHLLYPCLRKKINEQIDSSLRAISLGGRLLSNNEVKLGGLDENKVELMGINHLVLLGCGTSYFSGLMAIHFFKELGNFHSVQILDGADFILAGRSGTAYHGVGIIRFC